MRVEYWVIAQSHKREFLGDYVLRGFFHEPSDEEIAEVIEENKHKCFDIVYVRKIYRKNK